MYDEYVKKVKKRAARLARFERWVKAHRVSLIVSLCVFVLAVLTLMYFSGSFLKPLAPYSGVYGDNHGFGTGALLRRVDYTLTSAPDGTEAATRKVRVNELPAGEYAVEARTVSPFGKVRTQSAAINIARRPLTVALQYFAVYYGDEPELREVLQADNLAPGDRIASAVLEYDRTVGNSPASITSLMIVNARGEDVTGSYELTTVGATADVYPRPLMLTSGSAQKVYDGEPLTAENFRVTDGSVAPGERLEVSFTAGLPTEPGTYANSFDVRILKDGADVTEYYAVDRDPGKLVIAPVKLRIATPDYHKTYDGIPYVCDSYTITEGELLPGDVAKFYAPEITNAGAYKNKISLDLIHEETGEHVSAHYDVQQDAGTVVIDPRPLTVTGKDGEPFMYDGKLHYFKGAEITDGTLAEIDRIRFTNFEPVLHAGDNDIKFEVVIRNLSGEDAKGNYDLTIVPGHVQVARRPLTLGLLYDSKDQYNYYCGRIREEEGTLGAEDVPFGMSVPLTVPLERLADNAEAKIYGTHDVFGWEECTRDYDLKLHVEIAEELTEYSSQPTTDPGHDTPSDQNGTLSGEIPQEGFLPNDTVLGYIRSRRKGQVYLRVKSFGDYQLSQWGNAKLTSAGWEKYDNISFPPDYTYKTLLSNGFRITNEITVKDLMKDDGYIPVPYFAAGAGLGRPECCYYDSGVMGAMEEDDEITFSQITMMDTERLLGLKPSFLNTVYENYARGYYTVLPSLTRSNMNKILANAGISSSDPDVILKVADFIRGAAKYNLKFQPIPAGTDSVIYFLTESKEGVCSHFASAATVAYRALGIPARYVSGFLVNATDPEFGDAYSGKNAHAWVEVFVSGVGWVPIEVTPPGGSGGGDPIDQNGVEVPAPELEMRYNYLEGRMAPRSKEYDGEPLYSDEVELNDPDVLQPGHKIVAVSDSITYAGYKQAEIKELKVIDAAGNDVTDQYEINIQPAELLIDPVNIRLETIYMYVGEQLPLEQIAEISDPEVRALVGIDAIDQKYVDMLVYIIPNGDGTYSGSAVSDNVIREELDLGKNDGKELNTPEILLTRDVQVKALKNVRVMAAPVSAEQLAAAAKSAAPVYVEADNGRQLAYLELASDSAEKEFDGEYLTAPGYIILSGCLKPGHTLDYDSKSAQLYAGTAKNYYRRLRVLDAEGVDVTGEYLIDFYPGLLTVDPAEYRIIGQSVTLETDNTLDLSDLQWVDYVDNVPVTYFLTDRSSGAIGLEADHLIGVAAGNTELGASVEPVDLNGDGIDEFIATRGILRVTVTEKPEKPLKSWHLMVLGAAPIVLGGVVFLLLWLRGRAASKERME